MNSEIELIQSTINAHNTQNYQKFELQKSEHRVVTVDQWFTDSDCTTIRSYSKWAFSIHNRKHFTRVWNFPIGSQLVAQSSKSNFADERKVQLLNRVCNSRSCSDSLVGSTELKAGLSPIRMNIVKLFDSSGIGWIDRTQWTQCSFRTFRWTLMEVFWRSIVGQSFVGWLFTKYSLNSIQNRLNLPLVLGRLRLILLAVSVGISVGYF